MVQQRSFSHSRRAQVTIFMIVGLLLLFVAIFLIQLTTSIKKEQLTGQQEKVFGNLFQKEGLRIGVEDCFHDILQEGIVLLGKQGRIWSDQPGGTLEFVGGVTGTIPTGTNTRIAYAITNEIYPPDETEHENPYPCDPEYPTKPCPYIFPDSNYGFGEIQLRKDSIEKDLLAYTTAQIGPCVNELIKSKTSQNINIKPGDLDLHIKLENDGINVQVKYPLTLKLGDEELFHIADFDFFYDSLFKSFLDSAVVFPLQWDQRFVDFQYDIEQLQDSKNSYFKYASRKNIPGEKCVFESGQIYYTCQRKLFNEKFNSLDISLETKKLEKGDTLFIFTLPSQNILTEASGKYTYQFARQNRPPALDYITRSGCPEKGYDYLVIPGDPKLENLDITLNARDSDEDKEITYSFKEIEKFSPTDQNELNKGHLVVSKEKLSSLNLGPHTFKAIATDSHERSDHQTVRVLIDRPIATSFSIDTPYLISGKSYSDQFKDGKEYYLSQEDPFLLALTVPDQSNIKDVKQNVILTYENDKSEKVSWEIPKDISITKQETLLIPALKKEKDFNNLDVSAFNSFSQLPIFKTLTDKGKLKISFSASYCSDKEGKSKDAKTSQEAIIQIKECIPHVNLEHPFPYIPGKDYYKLFFLKNVEGKYENKENAKKEISPLLATHKCCTSSWTFKLNTEVCYEEPPEYGCFGKSEEGKKSQGQLLEKKIYTYFCPGDRGNVCGGKEHEKDVYESQKTCGKSNEKNCNNVASQCEGKSQWSYQTGQSGFFCHGAVGCGEGKTVCTSEIIDANSDKSFGKDDTCGCKKAGDSCLQIVNNKKGACKDSGGSLRCDPS